MSASVAPPPNAVILMLPAPSVLGFICSILSQANPGGAWWLFAGLGNFVGLLGVGAALVIAILLAVLRRIRLTFFGFVFVEIGVVALLLWFATKIAKNPWV